jgi:hypothetical protein
MALPRRTNIPSESTIEVLSNHFILHLLSQPAAWILCPTRNEEKVLGYDAHLRNVKLAIIQYKRIQRINRDKSISISIDVVQHKTLRQRFRRLNQPYLFYSFSKYTNYQVLDDDFVKHGAPFFFNHSLFFDAWDVPVGTTSLRLYASGTLKAYARHQPYSSPIPYYLGPEFINLFGACRLGERGSLVTEDAGTNDSGEQNGNPRVSVLHWALPSTY